MHLELPSCRGRQAKLKIKDGTFIIISALRNPAEAHRPVGVRRMVRVVSVCLIIALAAPPLVRGKCLCPDRPTQSAETNLPPCCRAPVRSKARAQYACCCCHRPNHGRLAEPGTTQQRRAAAISSDCECGRLKLVQFPWRWSPRRELPRHDEFEVFFHGSSVVAWTGVETRLVSATHPLFDSTGPPIHIWHCVWLI